MSSMVKEERDFYSELAKNLIKTSITRIESNASNTLAIVSAIATIYGAIVAFWVTSQNTLTPTGAIILAIPEVLLIVSAIFIAITIVPMSLKQINILSPDLTYETYSNIVKSKASSMKWSFRFLILALFFILIVMLSLTMFREIVLKAVTST
ncbi:hypothetical protein ACFLRN_02770 [Thermoproteota archaeon]